MSSLSLRRYRSALVFLAENHASLIRCRKHMQKNPAKRLVISIWLGRLVIRLEVVSVQNVVKLFDVFKELARAVNNAVQGVLRDMYGNSRFLGDKIVKTS